MLNYHLLPLKIYRSCQSNTFARCSIHTYSHKLDLWLTENFLNKTQRNAVHVHAISSVSGRQWNTLIYLDIKIIATINIWYSFMTILLVGKELNWMLLDSDCGEEMRLYSRSATFATISWKDLGMIWQNCSLFRNPSKLSIKFSETSRSKNVIFSHVSWTPSVGCKS